MKNFMKAVLAFLVLTGVSVPGAFAEEKDRLTPPPIEMMSAATMEKLAKGSDASEQNRILATMIGNWDFDLKYWSKKDAEPQKSSGAVTNEMILDNRFLSSKMTAILNIGGENIFYTGWSLAGYDTAKKAYTTVLLDTMRTGMTAGSAQYNEKLRTLEEKGRFTHPLLDKERAYRSLLEFTSDSTHKRTVYIAGKDGKEFKMLEIEYRRKQ